MKGPGYRHDLDVRRTWRCPECGRMRRVPGDVTTVRCGCLPQGVWMNLVGERTVPPRPPAMVSLPEQSVESFHLTEEELARPVEGRIRRRPSRFGDPAAEASPPPTQTGSPPPPPDRASRRPRPERRPKPEKRPLSELDHFGEPRLPRPENPPAAPGDDGFGAGLEG